MGRVLEGVVEAVGHRLYSLELLMCVLFPAPPFCVYNAEVGEVLGLYSTGNQVRNLLQYRRLRRCRLLPVPMVWRQPEV